MPNNDPDHTRGTDRHVGMELPGPAQNGNTTRGKNGIRPALKVLRFVIFGLVAAVGAAWWVSEASKNITPPSSQLPSAQTKRSVSETNAELAQLKEAPQDREKTEKP